MCTRLARRHIAFAAETVARKRAALPHMAGVLKADIGRLVHAAARADLIRAFSVRGNAPFTAGTEGAV